MIRRDFGGFGATQTPQQIVNERVAAMVTVNNALYAALADFNASANSTDNERLTWEVENWHTNAKKWMDFATEAALSETKFAGWRKWGIALANDADGIFGRLNNTTWTKYARNIALTFPSGLGTVIKTGVGGATSIVTQVAAGAGEATAAAGKGVGKTLLWVGLPLAAVFFIVTSGGRAINVGPFRIGGGR